jgi:hypothetical protein
MLNMVTSLHIHFFECLHNGMMAVNDDRPRRMISSQLILTRP